MIAEPTQLAFDGAEVTVKASQPAPLTPAQREMLRTIRFQGFITSTEAGVILHAHRDPPCRRRPVTAAGKTWRSNHPACCWHASSDGSDAMKRLMARGLVRRFVHFGGWGMV